MMILLQQVTEGQLYKKQGLTVLALPWKFARQPDPEEYINERNKCLEVRPGDDVFLQLRKNGWMLAKNKTARDNLDKSRADIGTFILRAVCLPVFPL
jgi:hypothetical protein